MAKKREKGEGCLKKVKGCRFWYAQYYKDGRQIRESTRETVKAKALVELRRLMGNTERGLLPLTDARKVRYADLRRALLDDYTARGHKSLQVLADGSETVWGLGALDEFFGFGESVYGNLRANSGTGAECGRRARGLLLTGILRFRWSDARRARRRCR